MFRGVMSAVFELVGWSLVGLAAREAEEQLQR